MYSKKTLIVITAGALMLLGLIAPSCSSIIKAGKVKTGEVRMDMAVQQHKVHEGDNSPVRNLPVLRDTIKLRDNTGKEYFVMKTATDEKGEMILTDQLDQAVVTASFSRLAERNGKVNLRFDVLVPPGMRDSRWQIRITPRMTFNGDTTDLEDVVITGSKYNQSRMRRYQAYQKMMDKIMSEYDLIKYKDEIEIFFARNIPGLYGMRVDSAYIDTEEYSTMYDVTQREVIEHYGLQLDESKVRRNERLKSKAGVIKEEIDRQKKAKIDTVMLDDDTQLLRYAYSHLFDARKDVGKVEIRLQGAVYEKGEKSFHLIGTKPYTFYISSMSTLLQDEEKYVQKVVERRAMANTRFYIDFEKGSSDIVENFGNNTYELSQMKKVLGTLMQNEVFDIDSIRVTAGASPEGHSSLNTLLAQSRGRTMAEYVDAFSSAYLDSLRSEAGHFIDEEGKMTVKHVQAEKVRITHNSIGEDWAGLDRLVAADKHLDSYFKSRYNNLKSEKDPDKREEKLRREDFYPYLVDSLYPKLRAVEFDFYLHRKGMVKDTVVTMEPDTVYQKGLAALMDFDYDTAAKILEPYNNYNAALALLGNNRNYAAKAILDKLPESAETDYLYAILWYRLADEQKAIQYYIKSCHLDGRMVYRGSLDPEISQLIDAYNLDMEAILSNEQN